MEVQPYRLVHDLFDRLLRLGEFHYASLILRRLSRSSVKPRTLK